MAADHARCAHGGAPPRFPVATASWQEFVSGKLVLWPRHPEGRENLSQTNNIFAMEALRGGPDLDPGREGSRHSWTAFKVSNEDIRALPAAASTPSNMLNFDAQRMAVKTDDLMNEIAGKISQI